MTRIICVLGVSGVGKSTYIDYVVKTITESGDKRPVTVHFGKFFREMLGPRFFQHLDNPSAPVETDNFVKSIFHHSFRLARGNNVDLYLDGFPRKKEQVDWLLLSSDAAKRSCFFEFRFIYCDELILENRRKARTTNNPEETLLMKNRSEKSAALLCGVHSYIKHNQDFKDVASMGNIVISEWEYNGSIPVELKREKLK